MTCFDNYLWTLPWLVLCENKCVPLYELENNHDLKGILLYYNPYSGWLVHNKDLLKYVMLGNGYDNHDNTLRGGKLRKAIIDCHSFCPYFILSCNKYDRYISRCV